MDAKHQSNGAVVEPIKIPKMRIAGDKAASINAFAISFAAFFGTLAIFQAIAGFIDKWSFGIPSVVNVLFANVGDAGAVIMGLLAVAFGIVGLLTLGKITDATALSKSWGVVAKTFFVLATVYVVSMVGIMIYSLLSLGRKGYNQGGLWLNSFLPNVITAGLAIGMALMAKKISDGKTAMLRVLSMIAMGAAGVGFILIVVQTLVGFYAQKGTSSSNGSSSGDYGEMLDNTRDWLDSMRGY